MVGYKDTDHWLLHTEVRGQEADAVKTCIKDQCCKQTCSSFPIHVRLSTDSIFDGSIGVELISNCLVANHFWWKLNFT